MSKTYKHQAKYDQKVYWHNYNPWGSTKPIYNGNDLIAWERTPPEAVPPEPHPWYWHGIEDRSAKYWHQWSNRRCRRKAKQLIHIGKYVEAEMLKPENVDWAIW